MLTIRKFAELAGTTRRTLLFYDQEDVFKPAHIADNGYRYYSYDQLYQLKFILQLRHLDLPLATIKELLATNDATQLNEQLKAVSSHIQTEIDNLTRLKATLTERFQQPAISTERQLQSPTIVERPAMSFWCSPKSVGCTDDDISALYQTFYQLIGPLKLLDKHESGFLTALANSNAQAYPTANFQIIKAVSLADITTVPIIQRPAGQYVVATAMNDMGSILHTLENIQHYVNRHHLTIATRMWQLNLDEWLTSKAGSQYISLEYQLM
ncbi:MerR family transcriptional regulator [Levilactobacillus brevis]|uniref:MerR family transcriptional regulator n=1 Tax=Levilactobacillus brevis TaxID=1580 RepID=UPI0011449A6B|nr:MerR family transcriptional regulator [Levilactobacillus brevis]MCT3573531.1 MerR family transcriptional regulator [Levilactobacillus brevis]GEA98824.1 MerR family transcriptional regulator [Levilactobacillus brevis]